MGSIDFSAWFQENPDFEKQLEEKQTQREAEEKRKQRHKKIRSFLLLPHVEERRPDGSKDPGFVNPYTFFPIENEQPWRILPRIDYSGITGKLVCSLEVQSESPLFIPNTTGCFENGDHRSYEFFSLDDLSGTAAQGSALPANPPEKPVIPGSEIRGMVRSIYEQLTNSCLPIIDEKNKPIKRTTLPKKPFRMEYDESAHCWKLFKTQVFHLSKEQGFEKDRCERESALPPYKVVSIIRAHSGNGKRNGISRTYVDEIADAGVAGKTQAYVHATGEMKDKHLTLLPVENIYTSEGPICEIDASDGILARFERVLDAYCTPSTESNHNDAVEGYRVYRDRYRKKQTVLVYADDGENPRFLSPSCISPESFDTTVLDLLKEQGSHDPCKGPAYCPACRLFGAIGDEGSIGSRVRFSQADPDAGYGLAFGPPTTLAALSTPRASATEFYLKRPDVDGSDPDREIWNFDYLLTSGEKKWPYKEMKNAGIQGRKVYWHFPFNLYRRYEKSLLQPSKQNITVRPLKQGRFEFTVFFENLSEEELANLVFAIGGMGEGRLQKLGHGKPLGMGSVLAKVEKCETKRYELVDGRLESKPGVLIDKSWVEGQMSAMDGSVVDEGRTAARRKLIELHAQKLSDIPLESGKGFLGDVVSYPKKHQGRIGEKNTIFEWFSKNRGKVGKEGIKDTLSPISVDDIREDPDLA